MKTLKITAIVLVVTTFFIAGIVGIYKNGPTMVPKNLGKPKETIQIVGPTLPKFEHTSRQNFLDNVIKCTVHVKFYNKDLLMPNLEVLLAQAALESAWGMSRFAVEGKNLFGIRTFNLKVPHIVPTSNPKRWAVRAYDHECDSVLHYVKIVNNGKAYKEYRDLNEQGVDALQLVDTLGAYAEDKSYMAKVKSIIKYIRKNHKETIL